MTFSVGDTVKVSTVEGQRIGTLISSGSVGDTVHVSMVNGQRVGNRITSPSVGDTVLVKTIGGRRYAIASGSSGLTAQMFGQRSCVLSTGEIIITGGYINIPTNTYAEYCQISNDAGRSWRNYSTPPGFGTRAFHCCVVLPSGELVLAGGSNGDGYARPTVYNDVWISSDKGVTWTQQTAAAGWAPRYNATLVALSSGELVLAGGVGGWAYPRNDPLNDVWISSDKGVTWTQLAAAWLPRGGHGAVTTSDGKIIIFGGAFPAQMDVYNDVWISSDKGVTWTQQTAAAGWAPRFWFSSVILSDGSILIMGGLYNYRGLYYGAAQDVWKSTNNGVTWTRISGPFPPT